MSEQPQKNHPWAKFRAPPSAPGPRVRTGAPAMPAAKGVPKIRVAGAEPVVAEPAAQRVEKPGLPAGADRAALPAERPKRAPSPTPPRADKPAVPAGAAAKSPADEALAAAALAEVEVSAAEAVAAARRERRRRQPWWALVAARDSVRNWRETRTALRIWWAGWRGSAGAKTLLAFVVLYGLLATMRAPSPVAAERSRQREDAAYLQAFLKDFTTRGGTVLARKPHGGSELYPRGVVLQGEALEAFQRAPVGGVFVLRPGAQGWNPLSGFYGFPSVFVGGGYFHLERPFDFARFRCAYLIRKDSDRAGAILVARVEPAY